MKFPPGVEVVQRPSARKPVRVKTALTDPTIPYPGRRFYAGAWRTEEQIERRRQMVRRAGRRWYAKNPGRPHPNR